MTNVKAKYTAKEGLSKINSKVLTINSDNYDITLNVEAKDTDLDSFIEKEIQDTQNITTLITKLSEFYKTKISDVEISVNDKNADILDNEIFNDIFLELYKDKEMISGEISLRVDNIKISASDKNLSDYKISIFDNEKLVDVISEIDLNSDKIENIGNVNNSLALQLVKIQTMLENVKDRFSSVDVTKTKEIDFDSQIKELQEKITTQLKNVNMPNVNDSDVDLQVSKIKDTIKAMEDMTNQIKELQKEKEKQEAKRLEEEKKYQEYLKELSNSKVAPIYSAFKDTINNVKKNVLNKTIDFAKKELEKIVDNSKDIEEKIVENVKDVNNSKKQTPIFERDTNLVDFDFKGEMPIIKLKRGKFGYVEELEITVDGKNIPETAKLYDAIKNTKSAKEVLEILQKEELKIQNVNIGLSMSEPKLMASVTNLLANDIKDYVKDINCNIEVNAKKNDVDITSNLEINKGEKTLFITDKAKNEVLTVDNNGVIKDNKKVNNPLLSDIINKYKKTITKEKEEAKVNEPKVEQEQPKVEQEAQKEQANVEQEAQKEEPKQEQPKVEQEKEKEEPKVAEPKKPNVEQEVKKDEPKKEEPKVNEPNVEKEVEDKKKDLDQTKEEKKEQVSKIETFIQNNPEYHKQFNFIKYFPDVEKTQLEFIDFVTNKKDNPQMDTLFHFADAIELADGNSADTYTILRTGEPNMLNKCIDVFITNDKLLQENSEFKHILDKQLKKIPKANQVEINRNVYDKIIEKIENATDTTQVLNSELFKKFLNPIVDVETYSDYTKLRDNYDKINTTDGRKIVLDTLKEFNIECSAGNVMNSITEHTKNEKITELQDKIKYVDTTLKYAKQLIDDVNYPMFPDSLNDSIQSLNEITKEQADIVVRYAKEYFKTTDKKDDVIREFKNYGLDNFIIDTDKSDKYVGIEMKM